MNMFTQEKDKIHNNLIHGRVRAAYFWEKIVQNHSRCCGYSKEAIRYEMRRVDQIVWKSLKSERKTRKNTKQSY